KLHASRRAQRLRQVLQRRDAALIDGDDEVASPQAVAVRGRTLLDRSDQHGAVAPGQPLSLGFGQRRARQLGDRLASGGLLLLELADLCPDGVRFPAALHAQLHRLARRHHAKARAQLRRAAHWTCVQTDDHVALAQARPLLPSAETMPEVAVWPRPNGLPIATTKSPTRSASESPHLASVRFPGGTLTSATSVPGSEPISCAGSLRLSFSVITTSRASFTTCALVTT